jgi:hypothetical protein
LLLLSRLLSAFVLPLAANVNAAGNRAAAAITNTEILTIRIMARPSIVN